MLIIRFEYIQSENVQLHKLNETDNLWLVIHLAE